ncbi:MAG: hypothetical protein IPQ01_09660, partial [Zoogloea sp.]|nr:hypothetical protein [Zoogloea sp.]
MNEGSVYALGIGAILDPGADTVSEYRIVWGDETTPGSYQSISAAQLALNGGVVTHSYADGAANYNVQVFAQNDDGLFALGTHAVDVLNVAPTVDASGAASATVGVAYTLSLANYLDPGQDTLLPNGIVVDWGDGTQSTASSLGDLTHTYLAASTPTLTVSLADEDGSYANVASLGLTVGLPTPTLSLAAQANAAVNEGSTFTRSIAFSDGEDSNGDGWSYNVQWNDGVVQSGTTAVQHFDLNRTAADGNATLTATITVADLGGADSDTESLQLNVANVAPTASISGASAVDEGSVYTLTVGAILDPGTDTRSGYTIAWGDGSTDSFTPADWVAAAGSFTHTYADGASASTITVSTTDEDGTTVLGTQAVTVANVAPSLVLDGAASTLEGATYQLTLTGSDAAGSADPLAYSIAWGDGSTQTVLAADLPASGIVSHVFADDEDGPANATARQVTVTVTDGDGGSTEVSKTVTVANVAPTASVSGPATVDEGSVYTLTVGAILDPGTDTRSGYTIAWGDGSTDTFTPADWAAAAGNFTHTYADGASTPTITVSTTDEDGTTVLGTQAVTVNNVAPSLVLDGAASTLEGATYQLILTGSDAAGSADPLAYSIAWGDGSTQTVLAADLPASGIVSHVFADDEDGPANATARQVTVTVTDGDGGSTEVSKTVTVSNVAPTIEATGAASTTTGLAYTLSLANYLDPGQDTLLPDGILINWGDGSTSTASAVGDITHTYSAAGTPTILVSLADEDGSYANVASLGLTVALPTATLSIAAQANAAVNEGSNFTRSIAFSDGEDSNGDGWSYNVQWNDGVVQSGTTTVQHFDL